jgi:hypothetical protein
VFLDFLLVVVSWGIFLGWLAYLEFIQKDLSRHKEEIRTAAFFLGVMTVIYGLVLF